MYVTEDIALPVEWELKITELLEKNRREKQLYLTLDS